MTWQVYEGILFQHSTYVGYMVVDYCLSCKEFTALQSCQKKNCLQNPDRLLMDSWWSPGKVLELYQESTWGPPGVHQEFTRSPYTLSGVHQESIRSPPGVSGLYQDSWWSPSGVHLESTWSPSGSVGECNLQHMGLPDSAWHSRLWWI